MGAVAHVRTGVPDGLAYSARMDPILLECMCKGGKPVSGASTWSRHTYHHISPASDSGMFPRSRAASSFVLIQPKRSQKTRSPQNPTMVLLYAKVLP